MSRLVRVAAKAAVVVLVLAWIPGVVAAAVMAPDPPAVAPESAGPALVGPQTIPDTVPKLAVGRFTGELHLVLEQKHVGLPEVTVDGRSMWAIGDELTYTPTPATSSPCRGA